MRIEGPLVAKLQAAFQEHWVKTFGEALTGADQFPSLPSAADLKAQVVASRSFSMAPVPLLQGSRIHRRAETHMDYQFLLHADRQSSRAPCKSGAARS